jgi:hypothetical protein
MDNQSYIREEVRKLNNRRSRRVAAQSVVPKRSVEKRAFMTTFLGSCILMLTLITLGGMIMKHGNVFASSTDKPSSRRVVRNDNPVHRPVEPIVSPDRHMTQRDGDALTARVDEMSEEVKLWTHRQWLMGLALNENANIARNIDRRYHGNTDSGFITFDKEWQMNKMPDTMDITQDQRDRIRNGPK